MCYMLSIVLGRHSKRTTFWTYCLLALLAAIQVAVVLIQLYTLESPIDK